MQRGAVNRTEPHRTDKENRTVKNPAKKPLQDEARRRERSDRGRLNEATPREQSDLGFLLPLMERPVYNEASVSPVGRKASSYRGA